MPPVFRSFGPLTTEFMANYEAPLLCLQIGFNWGEIAISDSKVAIQMFQGGANYFGRKLFYLLRISTRETNHVVHNFANHTLFLDYFVVYGESA